MRILKDLVLVVGGAVIALALQPAISVSQGMTDRDAARLVRISQAITVDQAGNVNIKGSGNVTLRAPRIDVRAGADLNLQAGAKAALRGGVTQIGSGKLAPAVNITSSIICPAPGAPCTILPVGGSVLIGP